jgi:alcohol dehydrogenase class IV
MRSFQHITPPQRLFSGPASLGLLGPELERLNSRRAHRIRAQPLQLRAPASVAVGGGSAIVTARAASILPAENGDLKTLCTLRDQRGELVSPRLLAPKLPHLVVPTTPTTATVKAGSAVFDPADGARLALFDPKTRAHAIFIHPELVESAPRELVVTASLDTFVSAVEGLTSHSGDPISDALLMHALRLLALHLPDQVHGDADPAARGELIFAAVLCGQGTDYTGAGIATVLGHAVGAPSGRKRYRESNHGAARAGLQCRRGRAGTAEDGIISG